MRLEEKSRIDRSSILELVDRWVEQELGDAVDALCRHGQFDTIVVDDDDKGFLVIFSPRNPEELGEQEYPETNVCALIADAYKNERDPEVLRSSLAAIDASLAPARAALNRYDAEVSARAGK